MGEEIATSAHPLMPRGVRARGVAVAVLAIIASGASACGDDAERQDADEPAGDFPVEVTSAKFPTDQRLAQTSDLELEIENAGDEDVPDLAVTIFTGDQPSSGSFSVRSEQPGLADPNRPVWILENGFPKLVTPQVKDLETAPPAGAEAAQTNTFSFGAVPPGESKDIVWRVTPVQAGTYTVHYELAAGLNGKAKAVTRDGGPVEGEFVVTITDKPPQARVNSAGEVEISE
ncbi:MAG: hypothetical protein ABWZ03_01395 [Solirubrobacterales bacterium]